MLLALVPRCPLCATPRAVGHAILPLSAAVDLPGQLRAARPDDGDARRPRSFGPAVADARGRFSVPVVIPPGARFASASTVDALGNRRATEIDLHLPEVDRLACAAWPRALPADGRAEASVWCVASTARARPAKGARLGLTASAGEVLPLAPVRGAAAARRVSRAGGRRRRRGRPARDVPGGRPRLARRGAGSRSPPGAPAELAATLAREPVPHGAARRRRETDGARRARRSRRPARGAAGREGRLRRPGSVRRRGRRARSRRRRSRSRSRRARRSRRSRCGARAAAGSPRRGPSTRARRRACRSGSAAAPRRRPTRAARPARRRRRRARRSSAPGGARAAGWAGIAPPAAPFALARTVKVALRPPSPVDVVASLEGRVLRWRVEDADGRPLAGRAGSCSARTGSSSARSSATATEAAPRCRAGAGLVAIADAEHGRRGGGGDPVSCRGRLAALGLALAPAAALGAGR